MTHVRTGIGLAATRSRVWEGLSGLRIVLRLRVPTLTIPPAQRPRIRRIWPPPRGNRRRGLDHRLLHRPRTRSLCHNLSSLPLMIRHGMTTALALPPRQRRHTQRHHVNRPARHLPRTTSKRVTRAPVTIPAHRTFAHAEHRPTTKQSPTLETTRPPALAARSTHLPRPRRLRRSGSGASCL